MQFLRDCLAALEVDPSLGLLTVALSLVAIDSLLHRFSGRRRSCLPSSVFHRNCQKTPEELEKDEIVDFWQDY